MNAPVMADPDRVLLAGIDRYQPAEPGGLTYPPLAGAVRDARGMENLLTTSLGVSEARIDRLLAPRDGPPPPGARLPTYDNLVRAFEAMAEAARPGEQVLIFYAGHGGRVVTAYPELKGRDGYDEALVPWNIGDSDTRYLRDVELAYLVHRMVERRLFVTLVLDCCHSGSALRAAPGLREAGRIDRGRRPAGSRVASREELTAVWRALYGDPSLADGNWFPPPRRYVLLAACEEHEKAVEYAFDGVNKEGAFSHFLLAALAAGGRPTYGQLRDRVLAGVHGRFPRQTPQVEGGEDRIVFEARRAERRLGINVLRLDPPGRRLLIHAGAAQGLTPGTRLAVGARPARTGGEPRAPIGAEVTETGSTVSWARVEADPTAVEIGAQAHLAALPRPAVVQLAGFGDATADLSRMLTREGRGLVRLISSGRRPDFQLAPGAGGRIEVRDDAGEPLANQGPRLWIHRADWQQRLAERLDHLARYHYVRSIPEPPATSFLSDKLELQLSRGPVDGGGWQAARRSRHPESALAAETGTRLLFELRNASRQPLYLTFLDLRPDWSVAQIYPPPDLGRTSLPLNPGIALRQIFTLQLPDGSEPGLEEIQIFATAGVSDFRWLLLPPLEPRRCSPAETAARFSPRRLRALEPETAADRGWALRRVKLIVEPVDSLPGQRTKTGLRCRNG